MLEIRKKRLEHLYKQLDHYYDDFIANLSSHDVFIVQSKLSPLLQTISSIAEMYYDTKKYRNAKLESRDYIYGLVRANNLTKHNKIVIEILEEDTIPKFSFPFSGPFIMGLETIVWKEVNYDDDPRDKSYHGKNQIRAYSDIFIGKEIIGIINEGIGFLKELQY